MARHCTAGPSFENSVGGMCVPGPVERCSWTTRTTNPAEQGTLPRTFWDVDVGGRVRRRVPSALNRRIGPREALLSGSLACAQAPPSMPKQKPGTFWKVSHVRRASSSPSDCCYYPPSSLGAEAPTSLGPPSPEIAPDCCCSPSLVWGGGRKSPLARLRATPPPPKLAP